METIRFEADDGEVIDFYILEEAAVSGFNYILVTDTPDDMDGEAMILKDISADDEEEAVYIVVEDANELKAVAGVFSAYLEDIDLEDSN